MREPRPQWSIRPFRAADTSAVANLVDADSDPLWVTQGHALHGEARNGDRWRRTLVVVSGTELVGAATLARNPVHPGRYSAAVEVRSDFRRRGVGGALLDEVRRLRPQPIPLAGKVRPHDTGAMSLVLRRGGKVYQRCPGFQPDPGSAAIAVWCARQLPPADVRLAPVETLTIAARASLWVGQYMWLHADWSPAARGPLAQVAEHIVAEADPQGSVVALRGEAVEAVAWAFPEHDGRVTIVCEAVTPETANGRSTVAAVLARCLLALASQRPAGVDVDGHVTDPNLAAVLESMPEMDSNPLLLVEV